MKAPLWIGVLASATLALPAYAHKPSDSYLTLREADGAQTGQWDIALYDLDRALRVDTDGDGALTFRELRAREVDVSRYALSHLILTRAGQPCVVESSALRVVQHSDGPYARLPLHARCAAQSGPIQLSYSLLFALDPQHRAIVRLGHAHGDDSADEQAHVITAERRTLTLDLARAGVASSMGALVGQGVAHILSGLDHVLFLLALLLPSVLRRKKSDADAPRQIRSVLTDVVRVVTAFTIAHSLTLGLAALGLVSLSADVVEPAIAASVALAAIDNLWPVFGADRWSIAFALGLLHGFGFSSALSDLGLSGGALLRGLVSFNVGVELGQLAIVLSFVPLAFALRNARFYRFVVLRGGSLAIAALAVVWFYERVVGG